MAVSIGIDPGWSSCGYALSNNGILLSSGFYVPKDSESFLNAVIKSLEHMEISNISTPQVYIERFVAYRGVRSSASEDILMFIGGLRFLFEYEECDVHLTRAIDWKPKLAKWLVKNKGFDNPSASFDKKFSLAAAEALTGKPPKTDHEADAICLSFKGIYD